MQPIDLAIAWRRLDQWGHDGCWLGRDERGWRLRGTAVFAQDGVPCQLGYALDVDAEWRTRGAHVFGSIGRDIVELMIDAAPDGWRVNGVAQPGTEGCDALDFAFTPATKMGILQRLQLDGDRDARVSVALLSVPDLRLQPVEQRFQRLTATDFLYACPALERSRVLRTDEHLAIVRYPGRWARECAAAESAAPAPQPVQAPAYA